MICGPGNDFGLKKGSKIIQGKKFYPVKLMVQKIFGLKKMQLVEKNSTATKFSIQKRFGPKKKMGYNQTLVQNMLWSKKICVKKVMGPNNFCVKENSFSRCVL